MKFTKEEKMAFVKRYRAGETVLSICSENQVPRSTFYRWIQDYQQTVTSSYPTRVPILEKKNQQIRGYDSGFKDGQLYCFLAFAGKTQGYSATLRAVQCTRSVRRTGGLTWHFLQPHFPKQTG